MHTIHDAMLKGEPGALSLIEECARLLKLPPGTPAIGVDYQPKSSQGKLVLLGQITCRADRFTFEVNLPQAAEMVQFIEFAPQSSRQPKHAKL